MTPVAITVSPDAAADRVMFQFGGTVYGLPVEDAVLLAQQALAAVDSLRPTAATGTVQ